MMNKLEGKKILITGGAGFIGSNLCEYFLENNEVLCMDNLLTGHMENIEHLMSNENFSFMKEDICDEEACKKAVQGVDVIFHQAALGSVPRSVADPVSTNANNVTGFLNMLNAARLEGVKRFVYAASSSTYGDHKELPKIEEQIGKPLSPYAVTKYVNELYASVFSELYGIETIGLRYFNVFGRRQDPNGAYAAVIPKFIDLLLKGESPTINGDGEQTRDFTYIDNVVQANELAALATNSEAMNEVYNVAYGSAITLNELVSSLKSALTEAGHDVSAVNVIHGPDRLGDIRDSLASIEKGKRLLGYNPPVDVEAGIVASIPYYVERLNLA